MDSLSVKQLQSESTCSHCKDLLRVPVMLTEKIGNVCHSCFKELQKDGEILALENKVLGTILNKLIWPCKNQHNGCNKRLEYEDLHEHQLSCRYRTVSCEMDKCIWNGARDDYIEHVKEHKQIESFVGDDYEIEGLEINKRRTVMLETSCGTFVFHMMLSNEKYYFLICNIGHVQKKINSPFTIECSAKMGILKLKCNTIDTDKIFIPFPEDNTTELKREFLESIHSFKVYINIESEHIKAYSSILQSLQCNQCKLYIEPPIYHCSCEDTIMCSKCCHNYRWCGKCSEDLKIFKNSALTNYISKTYYPCKFPGCHIMYFLHEDHESVCNYRPWDCPASNCSDVCLNYKELMQHVQIKHFAIYSKDDTYTYRGSSNCNTIPATFYIITHNRIFEIHHDSPINISSTRHSRTWYVNHIGLKETSFGFQIEIVSDIDSNRQVLLNGPCNYNNHDKENSNYIMLSDDLVHWLCKNPASFYYTLRIRRC